MRRWNTPKACSLTWRARTRPSFARLAPNGAGRYERLAGTKALSTNQHVSQSDETARIASRQSISERHDAPPWDANAWVGLLDGALPPHLRTWTSSPPNLSATDVAEILLAAQYPRDKENRPLDLLFLLGFEQNRWPAVVWLVKKLVERFPARHGQKPRLSEVNALWNKVDQARYKASMSHASSGALELSLSDHGPGSAFLEARSLDELTAGSPENLSSDELLAHSALGQIWRTLGAMIKTCAGGGIKQEVLEIIAYLHHKEIMPLSIYKSEPLRDKTAVQQPPLISVLSSRILTSLSDAAWRAHEKLVVEEAKAKGRDYASLRPEIPGTAYRVHVAGLRPEVWLELILWSCIHGGWTNQGAEILHSICTDKAWRPLSWREYEKSLPHEEQSSSSNWSALEHMFKTRAAFSHDAAQEPYPEVTRTISAEVINAYVDALASNINVGVGSRGTPVKDILAKLHLFKNIFHRKTRDLALSFTTWDAVALRILETQSIIPERDTDTAMYLAALSLGFGSSLDRPNMQDLPDYVLDGNAAMQGLLHRVLLGQIAAGSIEGALQAYRQLQRRADEDKMKSLYSFLASRKASMKSLIAGDMFTNNFNGIEFPAFGVQIPPTILGSFLSLVTDAKEFDFGRWLLHNNDIDGPVIGEALYANEYVQPAIIRYAAETNDKALLAKFKNRRLVVDSIRASLDSQVHAGRWESANRILQHLESTHWSIHNLATVVHVMLHQARDTTRELGKPDAEGDLASKMFTDMLRGRNEHTVEKHHSRKDTASTQCVLAVLTAVGPQWAELCSAFRQRKAYHNFELQASVFNMILSGVVTAHGSAAGRHLLGIFWPHTARDAFDATIRLNAARTKRPAMPRYRPRPLASTKRQRVVVPVAGQKDKTEEIVLYGALTPNTETILIILRKAMAELQATGLGTADAVSGGSRTEGRAGVDTTPQGMVRWGVRRLAELPYVDGSIIDEVDRVLAENGMDDVRAELPSILRLVEDDLNEDVQNATASDGNDIQRMK